MSATTTQPMTGQANQAGPIGAVVILVGALALGAVGIAIGQGYKATPASVAVPALDRGLDSPMHKGSVQQPIGIDRGLDSPLHKGTGVSNTGIPTTGSQYGYGYPTAGGQSGLNGTDVIPRSVFAGPSTGAQKGLGGKTESAPTPLVRRGNHIHR